MKDLIIDAFYIRGGGGLVYLKLFKAIIGQKYNVKVVSNVKDVLSDKDIHLKNIISREIFYIKNSDVYTLNLSNVPRILGAHDIEFLHQRYYVDPEYHKFNNQFTLRLKRLYFRLTASRKSKWIVQSDVMSKLLYINYSIESIVNPFYHSLENENFNKSNFALVFDDIVSHKKINKKHLIFRLLKSFDIDVKIVGNSDNKIEGEYLGKLSRENLLNLLSKATISITFSKFESLGLPFIESAQAGCLVVAPKSDIADELLENYLDLDSTSLQEDLIRLLCSRTSLRERQKFSKSMKELAEDFVQIVEL